MSLIPLIGLIIVETDRLDEYDVNCYCASSFGQIDVRLLSGCNNLQLSLEGESYRVSQIGMSYVYIKITPEIFALMKKQIFLET